MAKREFLMLAHVFKGQNVSGWYMSEKLDGVRCYWDGGITTGMYAHDVPWANTDKHDRYKNLVKATGLWTRYGQPIQAPLSFLQRLPQFPLDGELWAGRGKFQETMSIIKQLTPDERWRQIRYMAFDAPSYREIFCNGSIANKGRYEKKFEGIAEWCIVRALTKDNRFLRMGKPFWQTIALLKDYEIDNVFQEELSLNPMDRVEAKLAEVFAEGGEGVILRNPASLWVPERVYSMLKYKNCLDAEARIVGYTWGKKTSLGSKLLGMMGSMEVEWQGKVFSLSGFTVAERVLEHPKGISAMEIGEAFEGQRVGLDWRNPKFPIGSLVTFSYRELTVDGIPKEAHYMRKYDD